MRTRTWRWIGLGLVCLLAVAMPAAAQQPEMSAEEKAAMEAWTKAMTPGAEHSSMAANVGTWNATVTGWQAPGAPPMVSQGKSVRRMALGGRVMVDDWTGMMMGMPFEGMGTTGFDNVSKKWWGTWTDNMSTGMMTTSGTCDADPKKGCAYLGNFIDPMTGKAKTPRMTVVWPNPDEEVFSMYDLGTDGKEWKAMEIVAKRAK